MTRRHPSELDEMARSPQTSKTPDETGETAETPDIPESAETPDWLRDMAAGRFRGVVWYTKAWRGRRGVLGVLERDGNLLKLLDGTGAAVFSAPVAEVKVRHGYGYTTFKLRVEDQWWRLWGYAVTRHQRQRRLVQELAERHRALIEPPRFPGTTDEQYQRTMSNPMRQQQSWYAAWRVVLMGDKA